MEVTQKGQDMIFVTLTCGKQFFLRETLKGELRLRPLQGINKIVVYPAETDITQFMEVE